MRARAITAVTLACALAAAGAATAHVTLDKTSVPADSDQTLQVRMPGEKPPAYNVKLILEIPAGFTVRSCSDKVGWTCKVEPNTSAGRSALITWTRQSGVDAVDLFDFAVHTPKVSKTYPFEANQYYSDGQEAHWDDAPGGEQPAPQLEVTGGNTPPVSNSQPPTAHGNPTSSPRPSSSSSKPSSSASPAAIGSPSSVASGIPMPTPPAGVTDGSAPTSAPAVSTPPVDSLAPPQVRPVADADDDGLPPLVVALAILALVGVGSAAARIAARRLGA